MEVEGEDGGGGRREDMEGGGRIWREKMEIEGEYGGRRWRWRDSNLHILHLLPPYSPSTSISLHILGEDGGYGEKMEDMEIGGRIWR